MKPGLKIQWLAVASQNRRDQILYIAERNLPAAIAVGDAIEDSLARLADFPRSGRPGRVKGTTELVVNRTPFVIVYRVEADAVVILRLLHGAQRWP